MINPFLAWTTPSTSLNPEFFIDAMQGVKRDLANRIITDPKLNQAAHNYINSQTDFAKMLVSNAVNLGKYSMDCITERYFPKKD
jgi:hypothetical protein